MGPDTIGFTCPHCATDLVVPVEVAGVEGPCPICSELIRAPQLQEVKLPKLEPEAVRLKVDQAEDAKSPRAAEVTSVPVLKPVEKSVAAPERNVEPVRLEVEKPPFLDRDPLAKSNVEVTPSPKPVEVVKPSVPAVEKAAAVDAAPSVTELADSDPAIVPAAPRSAAEVRHSEQSSFILKATLIGVAGLALLIGLIVLVQNGRAKEEARQAKARVEQKDKPILSAIDLPVPKEVVEKPADPKYDMAAPPEGMDVAAVIQESAQILTTFLRAKSLPERLPMIETETPAEELKTSVLSHKLPLGAEFRHVESKFNKVEGFTDAIFEVSFLEGESVRTEIMMVRTRGTQVPKVLVDSFLDGYGGRLTDFTSSPEEGEKMFRTLVAVFDFCTSTTIPAAENKKTVKILLSKGGTDIAKGYFGKFSPLGKKLERLGMKYGRTTGATLTLRWNRTDDPARPYLEVIDVKSLDWD